MEYDPTERADQARSYADKAWTAIGQTRKKPTLFRLAFSRRSATCLEAMGTTNIYHPIVLYWFLFFSFTKCPQKCPHFI